MAKMIKTLSSHFSFFSLLSLFFFINQTIAQPEHMHTFCNQFSDNFTRTSTYRTNRETLLSTLLDRSSLNSYSYATTGLSPNIVRGMFLCRGDITRTSCSNCVQTATLEIARNCTYQKEAFIFYKECMVRYSDISFLTLSETRPNIILYSLLFAPNSNRFGQTLSNKMDELIIKASSSSSSSTPYFVEDQERVTQFEGSYDLDSIVQCSPDLDSRNCTVCLRYAVEKVLDCCSRSRSAQIFTPKCLLRFEASALPSPPPPSPPPPPPSPPFLLPSPPLFPGPQNVPSFSGSSSISIKGNENIGRVIIGAMTVYMLALLGI